MIDKLKGIKARYEELCQLISDPDVMADQERFRAYTKEQSALEEIVAAYDEFAKTQLSLEELKPMLSEAVDAELKQMIHDETQELEQALVRLEEELKILLLPSDPNDEKNVILEIRAGTGGEEAALFGADLLRMYMRYAERHGFKTEFLSGNETNIGGVKEVILSISGKKAYSRLKFESGVHRVQRVPETESQGRIHTSAATVAVLPEAEDVEVMINQNDLRVDVFRSGGHGGQSVNTTDSAVRITHLPTGLVVSCQDEKSQLKNKEKAMRVLKSRLLERYQAEQEQALSADRRSQVGSGDRSERIRTYNFPQGRVSDHRIGLTLYKLDAFIDGDLDEMIDALTVHDRARKLGGAGE